jgi:hypothetical protein
MALWIELQGYKNQLYIGERSLERFPSKVVSTVTGAGELMNSVFERENESSFGTTVSGDVRCVEKTS